MQINWGMFATLFLAIVAASYFEHTVLAPRMEHSPGKTLPATTAIPRSASDFIKLNYPNAVTVS